MVAQTTVQETREPHGDIRLAIDEQFHLWSNDVPVETFWREESEIVLSLVGTSEAIRVSADDFNAFVDFHPVKTGDPAAQA
jgi:hypothetical protein